ncbi:hypothetical protein PM082_014713 [Marasmius tenuissimus]|nr:hypothetical protein PM082_014713 [Marasmius tenuissimus]
MTASSNMNVFGKTESFTSSAGITNPSKSRMIILFILLGTHDERKNKLEDLSKGSSHGSDKHMEHTGNKIALDRDCTRGGGGVMGCSHTSPMLVAPSDTSTCYYP